MVYLERCSFDEATFHTERFVALNPNDPLAMVDKGYLLAYLGRAQEGVTRIERAIRLNPLAPQAYNSFYGMILFAARRYAGINCRLQSDSCGARNELGFHLSRSWARISRAARGRPHADQQVEYAISRCLTAGTCGEGTVQASRRSRPFAGRPAQGGAVGMKVGHSAPGTYRKCCATFGGGLPLNTGLRLPHTRMAAMCHKQKLTATSLPGCEQGRCLSLRPKVGRGSSMARFQHAEAALRPPSMEVRYWHGKG